MNTSPDSTAAPAGDPLAQSILALCRAVVRRDAGSADRGFASSAEELALAAQVAAALRVEVRNALPAADDFFLKVFELAPLSGDYLEFGVYRGHSLARAYLSCQEWVRRLLSGRADHLVDDPAALRQRIEELWARRRFIGFDSFEGMPEPTGVDRERIIW